MNLLLAAAFAATIVAGHPPRAPQPWHLMVAVERDARVTWLDASYGTRDECEEDLLLIVLTPTDNARIVAAYCEREPHTT